MSRYHQLKDSAREQQIIHGRILLAFLVILLLLITLAGRYYYLQIYHYELYATKSESNRVHLQRVAPKRGLILDSELHLLAENQPSYLLALVRERIDSLDETLVRLQNLGIIDAEDIERFNEHSYRYHAFEAAPIKFNLTDEDIAKVAVNRIRLPGVEVKANLVRHYTEDDLAVHMLGYVGRINEREISKLDADNYGATHHIGKIGIEKAYEDILHGQVGYEYVETNARGEVLRVLDRTDPVPGENLVLYLDSDVQKAAYDALDGRRGALVALDPRTGGVLAAVSRPSYDPNLFVNGISFDAYNALRDDIDLPLYNRIIQAQYPPGSTIKPIVSLAGLEEGVFTRYTTIEDPGWYQLPNDERYYRDWKRGGHGTVGFMEAVEQSCDVYYYELAYKLGVANLYEYYDQFGLGRPTGVDVPNERKGLNPSPEWKKAQGRGHWFPGDTLNIGIGQGFLLATPMQLAYATSIIANRGIRRIPQMVARIGNEPQPVRELEPLVLKNAKHWDLVIEAMESVVHGRKGTAKGIRHDLKYRIAGKTGTAQVVGIKQGERYDAEALKERQRDHALFVAFAPADDPQIVVAVIVENGEHGSSVAAPIARVVMDTWLNKLARKQQAAKEGKQGV